MAVDGWRERHGTCRYATYKPAATEGWIEAACDHPDMGSRYSEQYCAAECPAYTAREARHAAVARHSESDPRVSTRSCSWKLPQSTLE